MSAAKRKNRTDATQFFNLEQALAELDRLKSAYSALTEHFPEGSYIRELASNSDRGFRARVDYLHDSLSKLFEERYV